MGYFADLNLSSGISNISANKRQAQSEACDSIGVHWEMREKAGKKFSAIKRQALIRFFGVYEKSKWKLMHPLRRRALSSLTLVGDLGMPVATQPPMLLSGRRKTVHHRLVALVEQDKAAPSFPRLAQKPGGAASGAGSDQYCHVLDITRSCVHPCPWMDVMSAVIVGLLCQTYPAGLQPRLFASLATRGEPAASSVPTACNCGAAVLRRSQDAGSSFALLWHCKGTREPDNEDLPAPSHPLPKKCPSLSESPTTRSKQHTSRSSSDLRASNSSFTWWLLGGEPTIKTISYINPSCNSQVLSWLPR